MVDISASDVILITLSLTFDHMPVLFSHPFSQRVSKYCW